MIWGGRNSVIALGNGLTESTQSPNNCKPQSLHCHWYSLTLLYRGSESEFRFPWKQTNCIELSKVSRKKGLIANCFEPVPDSVNLTSSRSFLQCSSLLVLLPSSSSNTEMGSKLSSTKHKIKIHPKRSQTMARIIQSLQK